MHEINTLELFQEIKYLYKTFTYIYFDEILNNASNFTHLKWRWNVISKRKLEKKNINKVKICDAACTWQQQIKLCK